MVLKRTGELEERQGKEKIRMTGKGRENIFESDVSVLQCLLLTERKHYKLCLVCMCVCMYMSVYESEHTCKTNICNNHHSKTSTFRRHHSIKEKKNKQKLASSDAIGCKDL